MNKYRGDFEISLGDETFTLRPDFESLCEFEDKAQVSAYEALKDFQKERVPAKVIGAVIWSGIRGHYRELNRIDQAPSYSYIGQLIIKQGIPSILPHVFEYLSKALSSDEQLKAQEEKMGNAESGALTQSRKKKTTKGQ